MKAYSPDQWIYVVVPLLIYGFTVLALMAAGSAEGESNPIRVLFKLISTSLEQLTGRAGWAMAGALTGLMAGGIAAIGLYWDVAWHIDNGRDKALFTPSHVMILIGLGMMMFAAGIAVLFATLDRAPVGFRVGPLVVPWSALPLAALGVGAVAAFPLDNLWHEAYGIDVTLWSPTHLQLVAGGSLGPIACWLMAREGRTGREATMLGRAIEVLLMGAVLTGLSTFQGEFDFGVPQFQVLYFPILVTAATGIALVAARAALGRFGALKAVFAYVIIRSVIALLVTGALNHTFPRFPLYLAAALAVEAAAFAVGTEHRLRYALVAGAGVGTIGLAGELVALGVSGFAAPSASLLPAAALFGLVAGLAGAVIGGALGFSGAEGERTSAAAALGAGAVLLLALVYPLPRTTGKVDAVIGLARVGDGTEADVTVRLVPPTAAEDATVFGLVSWQGGGRVIAELEKVGPGQYRSSRPMPVTGKWKTMVGLQRGSEVMAAPIYLPADPEIGASAVPAIPERRVAFTRNTDVLLREAKDGPAWPAMLAYLGWGTSMVVWIALMWLSASRLETPTASRQEPDLRPVPTDWLAARLRLPA